jgi:hypothetical protein
MGLAACGSKIQFERDVEEINPCPSQKPKPLVRPAAYPFYSPNYRVSFFNTKNKYILFVILKTEHLLIKAIKEFCGHEKSSAGK